MKKVIAILVMLIVALSLFVACGGAPATEKKVRWESGEELTYKISLADFDQTKGENGNVSYYKDFLYPGELNPSTNDRIVPQALTGEYKVKFATVGENNDSITITTTETTQATYKKSDLEGLDLQENSANVTDNGETVVLTATAETSVTFKNIPAQTPVASSTTVDGYYVGNLHKGWSKYSVATTYKTEGSNLVAEVSANNGEKATYTLTAGTIDANQILTYIRSYDKASTSFQESPSVSVYDASTNTTRKMSFYYVPSQNVLMPNGTENVCAKLNRIDALLDGMPFMTQINLPDMTEKVLDCMGTGVSIDQLTAKHTTYRFRVGYTSYELVNYVTADMFNFVNVKAAE